MTGIRTESTRNPRGRRAASERIASGLRVRACPRTPGPYPNYVSKLQTNARAQPTESGAFNENSSQTATLKNEALSEKTT